jgi:hypothetical protein
MRQSPALNKNMAEKKIKIDKQKGLEMEKAKKQEEIKQERINLTKLLAKWAISQEIYAETIKDTEKEIESIESQIEALSESTDMEQFIERLPEVLAKTFELASKVLSNADIETMRSDIEQLLEICTFELRVSTKKELKVKLFEPLNEVLDWETGKWLPEWDSNLRPTG